MRHQKNLSRLYSKGFDNIWSPQSDVAFRFSKSWFCFNFSPRDNWGFNLVIKWLRRMTFFHRNTRFGPNEAVEMFVEVFFLNTTQAVVVVELWLNCVFPFLQWREEEETRSTTGSSRFQKSSPTAASTAELERWVPQRSAYIFFFS